MAEKRYGPSSLNALKSVHLRHKSDSLPVALSGGEQSAGSHRPGHRGRTSVVLADEPTGNLDPDTAGHIIRLFWT